MADISKREGVEFEGLNYLATLNTRKAHHQTSMVTPLILRTVGVNRSWRCCHIHVNSSSDQNQAEPFKNCGNNLEEHMTPVEAEHCTHVIQSMDRDSEAGRQRQACYHERSRIG